MLNGSFWMRLSLMVVATTTLSSCGFVNLLSLILPKENKLEWKFERRGDAQSVFNNSSVKCDHSKTCPGSVGGLVTYSESGYVYSVGVCSLTLIDENFVLTNAHCLPDDLSHAGASCDGRINIMFPEAGSLPAQKMGCAKVVAYKLEKSDGSGVGKDYAILKLSHPVKRPLAQVSVDGIELKQRARLYPVYFDLKQDSGIYALGEIRTVDCQTVERNDGFVRFVDRISDVFQVRNCTRNLIKGNSGSGLFIQQKLTGVFSSIIGPKGQLDTLGASTGAGTNLACISALNETVDAKCWE